MTSTYSSDVASHLCIVLIERFAETTNLNAFKDSVEQRFDGVKDELRWKFNVLAWLVAGALIGFVAMILTLVVKVLD